MSTITLVRRPGLLDYAATHAEMMRYTDERTAESPDQIWCLQHAPVFTLGLNGDPAHVLLAGAIPVVKTDRGGQVTYHGPGQLVAYVLLDLARRKLGVRALVSALENAVIATLAAYGIVGTTKPKAPGVYVNDAKVASLGLRIRRNCSYHGLALNVAMNLEPFSRINPCGFEGLQVTQVSALGGPSDIDVVAKDLERELLAVLG